MVDGQYRKPGLRNVSECENISNKATESSSPCSGIDVELQDDQSWELNTLSRRCLESIDKMGKEV